MNLLQIERPFIAYSLCFDDVMRTYLDREGISYSYAFGSCWEFEYDSNNEDLSQAVRFPSVGYRKYEAIGVKIEKKVIKDKDIAFSDILFSIEAGTIVPLHFDGYYCPWDTMQKKRRWHNLHTVLVCGIDKRHKNLLVCDPFYLVSNKRVPVAALGTACKFYLKIDTANYVSCSPDESYQNALNQFLNRSPILNMERFLHDLKNKAQSERCDWLFNESWKRMIDNGFMTRHYLWLFFRNLYKETKNKYYGTLELLFFSDLQLWKECVIYSLKGARRVDKQGRLKQFIETFSAVIEKEKEIYNTLKSKKTIEGKELISAYEVGIVQEYQSVNMFPFFNARACKKNRWDTKAADITGEGEYIIPRKKFLARILFKGISFSVLLGDTNDHLRCEGQELSIEDSEKWKGIAFLTCSEWGCSQFLIRMTGEEKEYFSDCVINDYTMSTENSIRIGKSFLKGNRTDVVFQKNIYLQFVYFDFPHEDLVRKVIMPNCPSAHVFSAVLVR